MNEKETIIELWSRGFNNRKIADMLNDKFETEYWDSERVRDKIRKYKKKLESVNQESVDVPEKDNKLIKIKNKKGLIICDIHFPHQRKDFFDLLNKYKSQIDFVLFGGDSINNDSLSKFPEIYKVPFEEEIINFYHFMVEVRNLLPSNVKIYIIRGNHEERLYKYLANQQENKNQLATFVNPEVIQMLVDGFTIYKNGKKQIFPPIENLSYIPHWFVNINDELIVTHPKEFSKVETKVAMNAIDYFMKRNEEFKMVIVAHTHKFGEGKRFGKFGIQSGCMCKPMKYSDKGSLNFSPQDYTYTIVEFDGDGKLDINKCKTYHLDELYEQSEDIDYKINL